MNNYCLTLYLFMTKFNLIWSYAYNNFEFYKNLKEKYKLPNFIKDIKSIREFPLISKKNLINYIPFLE